MNTKNTKDEAKSPARLNMTSFGSEALAFEGSLKVRSMALETLMRAIINANVALMRQIFNIYGIKLVKNIIFIGQA